MNKQRIEGGQTVEGKIWPQGSGEARSERRKESYGFQEVTRSLGME